MTQGYILHSHTSGKIITTIKKATQRPPLKEIDSIKKPIK